VDHWIGVYCIGAGGAFGYASGGVSWTRDTSLGRFFASDRQVVYAASAMIFIISCILNLSSIPENQQVNSYPLNFCTLSDKNLRDFADYCRLVYAVFLLIVVYGILLIRV